MDILLAHKVVHNDFLLILYYFLFISNSSAGHGGFLIFNFDSTAKSINYAPDLSNSTRNPRIFKELRGFG